MSNNEYQRPRGPHNPNSRPNQAPPAAGPRRQAPQEAQPPRSAAEPASIPRGPHKTSRPNQNPERRGPQKKTSQLQPTTNRSNEDRNWPTAEEELRPSAGPRKRAIDFHAGSLRAMAELAKRDFPGLEHPAQKAGERQSTPLSNKALKGPKREGTSPLSSPLSGPRKPPHSLAAPGSERRGPHPQPNSCPNQAPPSTGPRRGAVAEPAQQPPRSLAAPGPERRSQDKVSDFQPKQNPERRGPHKQISQPAAALTNSSNVRNGPKIKTEPLSSPAPTDAGKPHRQKAIRLTEAEVAKRLRKSPKTLRNWRSSGKGPNFMKLEGRILYQLVDVEAFEKKGWSGKRCRIIL